MWPLEKEVPDRTPFRYCRLNPPLPWTGAILSRLLAGAANYEDGLAVGRCVRQFDLGKKTVDDSLRASPSSPGPLAMADVDGDGSLDLFVGGRCVPGKYPRAAFSTLFRWADGKFAIDAENTKRLTEVGLVSGAVFCDLDEDGDADLVLACDWGPIRIRGCALADYDGDGRVDLAVPQNGAATKLYHNVGAKPGMRVRLQGPPNNPAAVGACRRLVFGPHIGPAVEIHAGSGYCWQDSTVQVLAIPEQPTQLWVRWPGGKVTTVQIPGNAREIQMNAQGQVVSHR